MRLWSQLTIKLTRREPTLPKNAALYALGFSELLGSVGVWLHLYDPI